MEGVENLEMQPRGTLRRRGRGMVRQPSWKQERPVSAPALRSLGVPTQGWTGSDESYKRYPREVDESGAGVGAARTTDEAE